MQNHTQSYNRRMSRVQLRQPILPLLIAFVFGLQLMEPSRAWTILLVVFTGIFVSAYLWARSLGESLHARRETHLGWVQLGGQIEERITLSNSSLFPVSWVEFRDQSTLPDFNASRVAGIRAGYFDIWNVSATCAQRGLFTLGDAKLLTGDPFGIFDVTIPVPQRTSLLVLPQVASLPEFMIAPSGSYGEGRSRRNTSEQTIHAASVREYAYGDSTRLIHWPTTARTDKVFVRLTENAPEGDWWILLDLDQQAMLGTGWNSIEEQSVSIAASLADRGLRSRKAVGVISNGKELSWLAPQKGEGQRWEIMQALAIAKPGPLSLSSMLERMQSALGKHHSLIIITAAQNPDFAKSLFPLFKRGIVPTVLLLDVSTFGGDAHSTQHTAAVLEGHNIKHHIIPNGMAIPQKDTQPTPSSWTWRAMSNGEIAPIKK